LGIGHNSIKVRAMEEKEKLIVVEEKKAATAEKRINGKKSKLNGRKTTSIMKIKAAMVKPYFPKSFK
jgi:hypothetical protein